MLSTEIYESWNAKTVADLKELLDNIDGPYIPKDVQSTTFKKAVLSKIDKRRATEASRSRDISSERLRYINDEEEQCCCSCFSKSNSKNRKVYECPSLVTFESCCVAVTAVLSKSIATVKALIQKLAYWESIKPGTDGLSVIGGYIWLLSFTCQHLIDCPNSKDHYRMQTHLIDIKEKYQELGQAGELFIELAEEFFNVTKEMRKDALNILKRLSKKWAIAEANDPLRVRPEQIKFIPRPRKRLGAGLDSPIDLEDDDDVFSVKWSPLTIYIQMSSTESLKQFGLLHPQDRVTVFQKFLQCTLDKVEMAAEDLNLICQQVSAIEVESGNLMDCRDITYSILQFTKGNAIPRSLTEKERTRLVPMLNEFWYSLDVLHENVYMLQRLVQETRDIIRTCYVYTDIFYKWHLPSYDLFIPRSRKEKSNRETNTTHAREILQKLNPGITKKLSETTSIMSLMDFSSSIYQGVVQEMPIQCEEMTLRLMAHDFNAAEEPMGLVSGIVDKRKSCVTLADGKKKTE